MASPKPVLTSNGIYRKVGGVKIAPHALVGQTIEINSNPVKPKKVVPARSSAGITGAGARNVAKLYRGGGIGMFGLPKNK
jgi:hypothetical protein